MIKVHTIKCDDETFERFRVWSKSQGLAQSKALARLLDACGAPRSKKRIQDPDQTSMDLES